MLVTTLTKKMAEDLTDYLLELGVRVRYLHSEVDTIQRIEILRDLRLGEFDVLVGINLLREGLDLPEVSLVAILDADKEGFLRSETSLIQTIGRAARNVDGQVIMYADKVTDSMQRAISETNRRRGAAAGVQRRARHRPADHPQGGHRHPGLPAARDETAPGARAGTGAAARRDQARSDLAELPHDELARLIQTLEEEMHEASADLRFEYAARLRDEIKDLQARAARGRLNGQRCHIARPGADAERMAASAMAGVPDARRRRGRAVAVASATARDRAASATGGDLAPATGGRRAGAAGRLRGAVVRR